jgi:hypothetical protein
MGSCPRCWHRLVAFLLILHTLRRHPQYAGENFCCCHPAQLRKLVTQPDVPLSLCRPDERIRVTSTRIRHPCASVLATIGRMLPPSRALPQSVAGSHHRALCDPSDFERSFLLSVPALCPGLIPEGTLSACLCRLGTASAEYRPAQCHPRRPGARLHAGGRERPHRPWPYANNACHHLTDAVAP